ncbi:MAG TPA: GNAT family N-acetyltransferase [Microbacterium sp.]|nr:GNAT family N-acetyltransferase [Microbacterium sp.]
MEYRRAAPADEPFLREMLWLAYNWRDETVAADHWPDPDGPRRYVEGFGRPGDGGVIAETGGEPAGAAWYRLLPAADAGYGYVADDIPEVTIGVAAAHRGQGVAAELLERLKAAAAADGLRGLSLSVEPDNHALRIYERAGFEPAGGSGGSVTLMATL